MLSGPINAAGHEQEQQTGAAAAGNITVHTTAEQAGTLNTQC
jgi:hypothetical protein